MDQAPVFLFITHCLMLALEDCGIGSALTLGALSLEGEGWGEGDSSSKKLFLVLFILPPPIPSISRLALLSGTPAPSLL